MIDLDDADERKESSAVAARIEACTDELEDIAESDLPAAWIAEHLLKIARSESDC